MSSRARKKKQKHVVSAGSERVKKQIHPRVRYIFILVCVAAVLVTSTPLLYKLFLNQSKPLSETNKNVMKKIPPDVKKAMSDNSLPASVLPSVRVPILLYHYIEYVQDKKDVTRQLLNINPNIFEQQVKTLVDAGYTFMTAQELGDILDGKGKLPQKPILLTFDDGHWDFATVVLPILKKYHVKATAYIISGFIGGADFMTSDQLKNVIASGLVEIGDHTVNHVSLKGKLYPIVQYEVDAGRILLEEQYHIHVVSFAYPGGSFDEQAIAVVKDDRFATAVSTIPGIIQSQQNRYFLFRIRPGYRMGSQLLTFLTQ